MNDYESFRRAVIDHMVSAGLSDKTVHAYGLVLDRAERLLERIGTDVLAATPSQIRSVAEAWPRTRSSRMQLRSALAWCWEAAERPSAPAGAIRVPSKPSYACRALSEPQAATLAAVARHLRGAPGLAVMLGLYAGLRREEIAALRWSDVDLEAGWLRVVGKGDVTADLPVHPILARRLQATRRAGDWVFPGERGRDHVTPQTIWGWVRDLSALALGEKIQTHRLRHTAIATLHDRTGDLRLAQAFARHASPETTAIYTRITRRRLQLAVEAIDYEEAK